jgi:hypothetical protein
MQKLFGVSIEAPQRGTGMPNVSAIAAGLTVPQIRLFILIMDFVSLDYV